MASKTLLAVLLCVMVSLAAADRQPRRPGLRGQLRARQCRIDQLNAAQPNDQLESEGGRIELWDEEDDQFQCAGVAAMRVTVQPDSLSLPHYENSPRLVYIEQGEGVVGVSVPGCPETYHSRRMQQIRGQEEEEGEEREGEQRRDMHQQTHRVRKGDVVAIPAGVVHWCFNDGQEDLVVVAVHNLDTESNQLDQSLRTFYLAGGQPRESRGDRETRRGGSQRNFQNVLSAFDSELLAEALGTDERVVQQIQEGSNRGFIVKAGKEMRRMVSPPRSDERRGVRGPRSTEMDLDNGVEEAFCNAEIRHNIDTRTEADIFSSRAGRINTVDENKLPILSLLDMSAEKGHILPNAVYAPHWAMNGHSVVYATRGDAQMQVVNDKGETLFDERIREGDMVVVPQFFVVTCRAGRDGFEYVSFKTTSRPARNQLNGYASVFRAMPVPVLSSAYDISPSDAFQLKQRRGHQQALFSPRRDS